MVLEFDKNSSALIVIDMQNHFLSPQGYLAKKNLEVNRIRSIIPNVLSVVKTFRKMNRPVIFTALVHKEDGSDSPQLRHHILPSAYHRGEPPYLLEDSFDSKIIDELMPERGEVIVQKRRLSAFFGTDLEDILEKNKARTVVITGVLTGSCVFMTAVDAFQRGYDVIILKDCVTSWDKDSEGALLKDLSQIAGSVWESIPFIKSLDN